MKTATLYPSLTLSQRLRAMTSAVGRADQEELDRLAESSRDGRYTIPKVKYHLCLLRHLAALHNSLLLEPCANWIMSQTFSPEEARSLNAAESRALAWSRTQSLAEAASIEAAFTARITGTGISSTDWQSFRERLLGEGAKHLLQMFLSKAAGHENPGTVTQYSEAIEGYLFKDAA